LTTITRAGQGVCSNNEATRVPTTAFLNRVPSFGVSHPIRFFMLIAPKFRGTGRHPTMVIAVSRSHDIQRLPWGKQVAGVGKRSGGA
jgi:hypothetical protein